MFSREAADMIKKKQTALFPPFKIIYFYLILIIAIITLGLAGFCFYYYKTVYQTQKYHSSANLPAARQLTFKSVPWTILHSS